MSRTVKFRPDQPLFKADALHMPLWVHMPFEFLRGIVKWLFVSLERDNPHRNAMVNATFTRAAKHAHRNGYWTGKPVVKGPKWKVMVRRWGSVFLALALVKYAPGAFWLAVAKGIGNMLVWFGLTLIPFLWAHWWMIPFVIAGVIGAVWLTVWLIRRVAIAVRERGERRAESDVRWYSYVLAMRDRFVRWVKE